MTLDVLIDDEFPISEDLIESLKAAADLTLGEESSINSVVNLRILSDIEMQQLNKEFRNKNRTTNVLSFTNNDLSRELTNNIGDIAISYDFVLQEAKEELVLKRLLKRLDEPFCHLHDRQLQRSNRE